MRRLARNPTPPASLVAILVAASALPAGCSARGLVAGAAGELALEASRSYRDEPDLELARVSGYANLKLLETLHRRHPDDEALTLALAEGFAGAALFFAEEEALRARCEPGGPDRELAADRVASFYRRAQQYALQALRSRHPDAPARLSAPVPRLRSWLATETGPEDARALAWLAVARLGEHGAAAAADPTVVGRARAVAARVAELDETLLYGLPRVLLGVIDATAPASMSVSPDRGRASFERALEVSSGRLLLARAERARTLHVATGDRRAFREDLQAVAEAPLDVLPGERLLTAAAKRRARRLLAREAVLFDGDRAVVHAYHGLPCLDPVEGSAASPSRGPGRQRPGGSSGEAP